MRVATAGVPQAAASVIVLAPTLAGGGRARSQADGRGRGHIVVEAARQVHPRSRAGVVDLRLQGLTAVALPHYDDLEVGDGRPHGEQGADEELEALHGDQPPNGHHEGRLALGPAGREAGIDAGRHDRHPLGVESEVVDELVARRLGERDDRGETVEGRRDPRLEEAPGRARFGGRVMSHISAWT